jgi:hypothetical protein
MAAMSNDGRRGRRGRPKSWRRSACNGRRTACCWCWRTDTCPRWPTRARLGSSRWRRSSRHKRRCRGSPRHPTGWPKTSRTAGRRVGSSRQAVSVCRGADVQRAVVDAVRGREHRRGHDDAGAAAGGNGGPDVEMALAADSNRRSLREGQTRARRHVEGIGVVPGDCGDDHDVARGERRDSPRQSALILCDGDVAGDDSQRHDSVLRGWDRRTRTAPRRRRRRARARGC